MFLVKIRHKYFTQRNALSPITLKVSFWDGTQREKKEWYASAVQYKNILESKTQQAEKEIKYFPCFIFLAAEKKLKDHSFVLLVRVYSKQIGLTLIYFLSYPLQP